MNKFYKIGDLLYHQEYNLILEIAGFCAWLDGEHYAGKSPTGMYIYPLGYLKRHWVKIGNLDD